MDVCNHCRYYKTKHIKGVLVSEYCKKGSRRLGVLQCDGFSRSLKSRLGLVVIDD